MKTSRLFATLALAMTVGFQVYAEDKVQTLAVIVTDDATTTPENTPKTDEEFGSAGVLQMEYLAIEDGTGLSASLQGSGFVLGAEVLWGNTDELITSNWGWNIFMGWQDRQFLSKAFFIEGRVAVKWQNNTLKMKVPSGYDRYGNVTYKEESNNNDFLSLVLSPRVGLKLGEKFAITAGYRWDFNKFKFEKEYTLDFFTVGIDIAF